MASYTKRMIEAAAPWLAANPDATDPAIKIPGHGAVDIQEATMAARLARIRAHARTSPEIAARVAELDQVIEEHTAATAELRESEGQIATLLSSRGDPCRLKADSAAGDVLLGPWYLAWARQAYNVFELAADFTAAMLLTDPATIAYWTCPKNFNIKGTGDGVRSAMRAVAVAWLAWALVVIAMIAGLVIVEVQP